MTLPHYSKTGKKQTNFKVSDSIFGLKKINQTLLKQAYEHYLNKKRVNLAKTKTRSLVRGGGRKPWPQKGRGVARAGTIRSPLFRGGGITFGPTGIENYTQKMNKKAKLTAIKQALSLNAKQMIVVTSLPTDGKTANMDKFLKDLKLSRKILLIDHKPEPLAARAIRNLVDVNLMEVNYLNVYKILNYDWLVFTEDAIEVLEDKLGALAGTKA